MTFVPAVLALLGDRAWRLPDWLDRVLPVLDVEGETLTRQLELADWPGDDSVAFVDGLEVDGVLAPFSMKLSPGDVVGLAGPVGPRTGAALALTGRLAAATISPRSRGGAASSASLRTRAPHHRLRRPHLVHDVAAAVRRQDPRPGSVVVVDGLETVGTSDEQAAVSELIKRTRSNDPSRCCCAPPCPNNCSSSNLTA